MATQKAESNKSKLEKLSLSKHASVDRVSLADKAPVPPAAKTISIRIPSVAFGLDENFKTKAPLLVLILLFFSFAAFLLHNVGLSSVDLVDVPRLQFNIAKLYSLSMILFYVLFALVLSLCAHFGVGQGRFTASLVFPVVVLAALVMGGVYPAYGGVYLSLALVAFSASIFASFVPTLDLGGAWKVFGRAMLVFVVLAFVLTFMKVNADPSFYSDKFLASSVALLPDVGGQLSDAINNLNVDETFLKGAISKKTYSDSISIERLRSGLESIPGLTSFNESVRTGWATSVKTAMTSDAAYNEFISLAAKAISDAKGKIADKAEAAASDGLASAAIQQVKSIPAFAALFSNFPLLLAFAVASLAGALGLLIKLLATLVAWLLQKVMA